MCKQPDKQGRGYMVGLVLCMLPPPIFYGSTNFLMFFLSQKTTTDKAFFGGGEGESLFPPKKSRNKIKNIQTSPHI